MMLTTEAKARVLDEVAAFLSGKEAIAFADCEADGETVDFARLKMAGNTKQTKQCKKGYSCGFSCIAKHLNCRKALTGQAATYAEWLSGQIRGKVELSPFHRQNAGAMGLTTPKKPVSAAFSSINKATKKQKAQIEEAIAAIDAVHTDGQLTPIPVNIINTNKTNGTFTARADDDENAAAIPIKIDISKQGDTPLLTMTHETGHFLDSQVLRESGSRFGSQALDSPEWKAWARAIDSSEAAQDILRLATGDGVVKVGDRSYGVDKKYLNYLASNHELFARSYAQWIAVKSGNPAMLSELKRLQGGVYKMQWDDNDFKPIATAMDNLFRSKGWLNESQP